MIDVTGPEPPGRFLFRRGAGTPRMLWPSNQPRLRAFPWKSTICVSNWKYHVSGTVHVYTHYRPRHPLTQPVLLFNSWRHPFLAIRCLVTAATAKPSCASSAHQISSPSQQKKQKTTSHIQPDLVFCQRARKFPN